MNSLTMKTPGLFRASGILWQKHMLKFFQNGEELFGTMIQPILWVGLFGLGMGGLAEAGGMAGQGSYVGFMLPGIMALSLLGGAIGGGMAWLDERSKGIAKAYMAAPIPRASIVAGNLASTISKGVLQGLVILLGGHPAWRQTISGTDGNWPGLGTAAVFCRRFWRDRSVPGLSHRRPHGLSRHDHALEPTGAVPEQRPVPRSFNARLDAGGNQVQPNHLSGGWTAADNIAKCSRNPEHTPVPLSGGHRGLCPLRLPASPGLNQQTNEKEIT
jgi:hypothetical protein